MASPVLSHLRRAISALEPAAPRTSALPFGLGAKALDSWLGGGLACGALHEVYPGRPRDESAAIGFGLGAAARAGRGRPLVLVRHDPAERESGRLYGAGLAGFGLDPEGVLVVQADDAKGALRASVEAARCAGLGAVVVEIRGPPRVLDLTASRRLALSARASGVTLIVIRLGTEPVPSAATTRWRVSAEASCPDEAEAPGFPAFTATLLRHRSGLGPRPWHVEWDHDSTAFADPPLSRSVAALPVDRQGGADVAPLRRRA
jgi:protein ImuA